MAALGQEVTVGATATLLFNVVDAVTYAALTSPAANVLQARNSTDPLALLLVIPTGATVFLGGSAVTASSTGVGCPIVGPAIIPYNVAGGDSLYGIVATGTAVCGLLAMGQ